MKKLIIIITISISISSCCSTKKPCGFYKDKFGRLNVGRLGKINDSTYRYILNGETSDTLTTKDFKMPLTPFERDSLMKIFRGH